MSRTLRQLTLGLGSGLATGAVLAWWIARYEPLSQQAMEDLHHPVSGEAELLARIEPERLRHDTATLSSISNRRGGTIGEVRARRWVLHRFRQVGLQRVHLEPVIYPRWHRRRRSELTLFTPAPYSPDFIVLNGSAATPPGGIECPLVDMGRGTEAEYAVRSGHGLAGTMHLITESQEHRRLLVQRATRYGAAGVILANPNPSPPGKQLIENGTATFMGRIPALAVSYETGQRLREIASSRSIRALMYINVGYTAGLTANVVGVIPGQKPEHITLAAHYDAWYAGAADNAAGLACLLELARIWVDGKLRPYRTLRFVSYAVEEEALMGSLFEAVTRAPWVKAFNRGTISVDVVGAPSGALRLSGYPTALVELAAELALQMGYADATGYPVNPQREVIYADHWPFARLRLPALVVNKGPDPFYHTPYDTAERLDYTDLRWTAALVGALALRLAQR